MCFLHGALKLDAFALDLEEHAALLIVHCFAQVVFERGHLKQDLTDLIVHDAEHTPRSI
jgi:hypothetical protein